ncbi:MAG: glycosyltransferase family 4 protein [bacterium]|nr:glycosyltransferase family 4 protein [bacterium]MDN5835566.1 glycosyltransferase family 4 protein [bacterium]
MRLFFDARWTRTDYYDGISRYGAGVIQGLLENQADLTLIISDKKQLDMLPKCKYILVNHPVSWRELFIARRLNEAGADVVFSPLQVMGFAGRKYKLILTLQDIIYYKHPKPPTFLAWYIRLTWWLFHKARWPQRLLLNRADFVSTVSQTSKKFITDWHLTDREVGVVYNAPPNTTEVFRSDEHNNDILYMGSFMPYKNVETLIEGLKYTEKPFHLHLLSKINPDRQKQLQSLVGEGVKVTFHNGVSDDEYQKLLANCFCLASASQEEGFGLPIIEAQSSRTPVVCTDMDIFHEVAGEGALYFDANDPADFAKQITKLTDEKLRNDLIEKGIDQAAKFTWENSGKALLEYVEKLVD